MNELIETDFETLVDAVRPMDRPWVASLMGLVEQYESGNFDLGLGDITDPSIHRTLEPYALDCLMRIYRYVNELVRQALLSCQRDFPRQGDSS